MSSSTRLKIKELLRERRWTTKVLAEKTGMSESYLTHIKNSTRRWNEDALKKLAVAFDLDPADLFSNKRLRAGEATKCLIYSEEDLSQNVGVGKVGLCPVLGEIPSEPTVYNNHQVQVDTGFTDQFVAVFNLDDEDVFCYQVKDNSMSPRFFEGDKLIISPKVWTRSGDIIAVEYLSQNELVKGIFLVNYVDDFIVLESVNHKNPPVALVRAKDSFKIIGKVVWRYQKLS